MFVDNTLINVSQDDTQLVLRFNIESIPDLAYVNMQLHERLQHEYNDDLISMLKDLEARGTVDVFFMPDEDDGSMESNTWIALTTILEEYSYALKEARTIIMWMDENVRMDDQDHVYIQILEGARDQ